MGEKIRRSGNIITDLAAVAAMNKWLGDEIAKSREDIKRRFPQAAEMICPDEARYMTLTFKDGNFSAELHAPKEIDPKEYFEKHAAKIIKEYGLEGKVKLVWEKDEPPLKYGEPKEREALTDKAFAEILDPEVKM